MIYLVVSEIWVFKMGSTILEHPVFHVTESVNVNTVMEALVRELALLNIYPILNWDPQ